MSHPTCPQCGEALPLDTPEGLCAACLLSAAAETITTSDTADSSPTFSSAVLLDGSSRAATARLQSGDRWGAYRIGRLLGRGGMGEVYEAEQTTTGRRVALKILRGRLHSAGERARFLREGQLAASISHPHTVYIFGSEEIAGAPVITMELLPGGTLKDRVNERGPMAPAEAVAAVMDLIGGLDAAAAAGILHRDIKPSNCFVDRDGTVKIGDFGLSISTLARDVRHELRASGFEGTPQFAPPEQLRGDPLDVRADIYAVGATLYYLLTGRPPFDAADLRDLFARVATEPARSPRELRPEIPSRLASVVLQCLAKTPDERPASHAALANALRPFLSRDEVPARPGSRLVAWFLDGWLVVGIPVAGATMLLTDPLSGPPERAAAVANWAWLATFVYFLVIEGWRGASLSKQLLGLRVVTAEGGRAPSWGQILRRTAAYLLPNMLITVAVLGGLLPGEREYDLQRTGMALALATVLFVTARRSNGWRGLHELVSGTRTVARHTEAPVVITAPTLAAADNRFEAGRWYGPFIADANARTEPGSIVHAFDPVLRRAVWIHLPQAATSVTAARRDLSRPGRLHWLTGHRSDEESWDAFEAPSGGSLLTRATASDTWSLRKQQLFDLANELAGADGDGTLPPLALDRLWVRADGRLLLLEFPAPGADPRSEATLTPEALLAAVAHLPVDETQPDQLPLSARLLRAGWSARAPASLPEARAALSAVVAGPTHVASWRRAVPIAASAAPVLLMLFVSLLLVPSLARFASADTTRMMNMLGALRNPNPPPSSAVAKPEVRQAMETYIAGRYRDVIQSEAFWNTGVMRSLAPQYRGLAEDILRRNPGVSAEQTTAADALLTAARRESAPTGAQPERRVVQIGGVITSAVTAAALAIVVFFLLLSAVLVPGGVVVRQLGLAVVTQSGREITRLRSLGRALFAMLPAIAWFVYLALAPKVQGFVPTPGAPLLSTTLTVGVLGLGALWTISRRTRGPHDVLLGTWVIPR